MENHTSLPDGYGDNKVVLMTRDPRTIYSYWEINKITEDRVRQEVASKGLTPAKSVLRVYDITEGVENLDERMVSDFELKNWANSWYIHVDVPGRSWMAEVGILCQTGEFFSLARSNNVSTPRDSMSDICDEDWMCPEELYYKMFALSGGYDVGESSLEMSEIMSRHLKEWLSSGGVTSGVSGNVLLKDKG